MLAVVVVYVGLITAFVGTVSLVKLPCFLGIRTRLRAAFVLTLGLVVVVIGWAIPAREQRVAVPRSRIDEFAPVYQFNEFHSLRVSAPKEQVYRAVKAVTADEIFLFRTLTWIRRFGRPGPESILSVPERQPLLEVATRTSFLLLAERPNHEIVLGTVVAAPRGWRREHRPTPEDFKAVRTPGFALATMNFFLEDAGPGSCLVTTETRVYATDAPARRRFAAYWRVIYPGSALIRRMWLRAIARRAQTPSP